MSPQPTRWGVPVLVALAISIGASVPATAGGGSPAHTELISQSSDGVQGDLPSFDPSVSANGNFVAFESDADNLVPGDTGGFTDVFVRDRAAGTTERVSVTSSGVEANGYSLAPSISGNGRFVAFFSDAKNLAPGDTNGTYDVFVRDRQLGTTELVSVGTNGRSANGHSLFPAISSDGRFVAFTSNASNLVVGDTNHTEDVFVRDLQSDTTTLVSVAAGGGPADGKSFHASITTHGDLVAFASHATNLVPGDTNGLTDVFVRDLVAGTTELASVGSDGKQGKTGSWSPSISPGGRYVVFVSDSTFVPGTRGDIYLRDRHAATTISTGRFGFDPVVAAGGVVAFSGELPWARRLPDQILVWKGGRIIIASESNTGHPGHDSHAGFSENPSISADGSTVAFQSRAANLVPPDTNGDFDDVFVRAPL